MEQIDPASEKRSSFSPDLGSTSGQAVLEYILLLAIVVSLFVLLTQKMLDLDLLQRMVGPYKTEFERAYRYGSPKSQGVAEGQVKNLPQYEQGFRIFYNPPINR